MAEPETYYPPPPDYAALTAETHVDPAPAEGDAIAAPTEQRRGSLTITATKESEKRHSIELTETKQEEKRERQGGAWIEVQVKSLTGTVITISPSTTDTIAQCKTLVQEETGVPNDQQRLIFGGKQLEDKSTLADYGIKNGNCMHLVLKLSSGDAADKPAAAGDAHLDAEELHLESAPTSLADGDGQSPLASLIFNLICSLPIIIASLVIGIRSKEECGVPLAEFLTIYGYALLGSIALGCLYTTSLGSVATSHSLAEIQQAGEQPLPKMIKSLQQFIGCFVLGWLIYGCTIFWKSENACDEVDRPLYDMVLAVLIIFFISCGCVLLLLVAALTAVST